MVKKKIIEVEVCTCDRCRKELEADHWKIKMTRTMMDRELDLCDECEMLFKAFMMNKPYEVPETDNVTEEVKGTDSYVGILSSDIDFKRGFPTRLRAFMDKNQFTQKDMAELIGVGTGTISNWLRGLLLELIQGLNRNSIRLLGSSVFNDNGDDGKSPLFFPSKGELYEETH